MRKILFGLLVCISLLSCSKDEEKTTPLVADFDATIIGESPNAKIIITNASTGAKKYAWTFSEGANISSSSDENPDTLFIDKRGNFEVKLVISNDNEQKELTKNFTIPGYNAIVTYTDIEFGVNPEDETYGRFFSFETGRIYKDKEIVDSIGQKIGIGFSSMEHTMYYFQSPSDNSYNIPNATITKVTNYANNIFSIENFDSMVDDRMLSTITIDETHDSFGNSSIPCTVLFQLANSKKGVIKVKAVNNDRVLVDIKIQKYN
ncbi:MAG: hypothetical protein ACP5PZ_07475 [Bacteroidales bacterium]